MAEKMNNVISVIYHCQSKDAKKLEIRDFVYKATHSTWYDLGGTYTGSESDLWFYMNTETFSEKNHLLNVFVCHRKVGNVTITITFNDVVTTHIYKSTKPDENYHLKTICVDEPLIESIKDNVFYFPVTVEMDPTQLVHPDIIRKIKIENSLGEQLLKQKKTDFILESISRKQYPVHRVVLCAHSPVLRELVKSPTKSSEFLDISDKDMDVLIQFLYTGAVKDLQGIDCMRLQELASRFKLSNLFLLAQHVLCEKINVENVINIAVFANRYNLDQLWTRVCNFILQNPAVLKTESWESLEDVELAKKICAHLVK